MKIPESILFLFPRTGNRNESTRELPRAVDIVGKEKLGGWLETGFSRAFQAKGGGGIWCDREQRAVQDSGG